ncbi:MAG: hypothetical protein K8W52_34370 [Deltaproteobacteria bacterium]|nr:hypothetical protein [Deltaproteobacteria bacterium]
MRPTPPRARTALAALLLASACGDPARAGEGPSVVARAAPAVAAPTSTHAGADVPVGALGDPAATGEVIRAVVVSQVDAGPIDDTAKHARADQRVTLHAVAVVQRGRDRVYFSDAPDLRIGGKRIAARPFAEAPGLTLAWARVEPAAASMSNTEGGGFRYEAIDYRATAIDRATAPALVADVRPTLTPDHGNGVGTMRYQLTITQGARAIASPGAAARRGRGSGGLQDSVHRISIRRDDTYLGWLTELYGQPYIWASAGGTDATHQSERLEGSDCADFVTYGARRLGLKVPYSWTGELPQHTRTLATGQPSDDGIYRDAHGAPVRFPAVGDLVLFPRHVGALVEDRGTIGVLDEDDIIMHALFDTPKEVRIADSGYGGLPIQVLRWPKAR